MRLFHFTLFEMSEVQMNRKPARENKGSSFFLTINYQEAGIEALQADFVKISEELPDMCTSGGILEAASFWEERGLDTGNPHLHGILIFKRDHRTRCPAVANLLSDVLGLTVRPHIEPLKDLRGAIQYRDKPSKAEAWSKWTDGTRAPSFFVLIHSGNLRYKAARVLGQILGGLSPSLPITRRLF